MDNLLEFSVGVCVCVLEDGGLILVQRDVVSGSFSSGGRVYGLWTVLHLLERRICRIESC